MLFHFLELQIIVIFNISYNKNLIFLLKIKFLYLRFCFKLYNIKFHIVSYSITNISEDKDYLYGFSTKTLRLHYIIIYTFYMNYMLNYYFVCKLYYHHLFLQLPVLFLHLLACLLVIKLKKY